MSGQEGKSNAIHVSPRLGILLIDEGFAIKADDNVYQRNPGIDYFSYRKWRKTEDYTIQSSNRNKVYCVTSIEPIVYTREQVLEQIQDSQISIIPPQGQRYTPRQVRQIYIDIRRLCRIIAQFISN